MLLITVLSQILLPIPDQLKIHFWITGNVYLPTTNYPKIDGNQNESKDVRIDLPVEIVDEGKSS